MIGNNTVRIHSMNHYYRGFIDACVSHGMDKRAAELLYKQGQGAGGKVLPGIFRTLGRGSAATGAGAEALAKGTAELASKAYRGASELGHSAVRNTERAINATTDAVRKATTEARNYYREGVNEWRAANGKPPLPPVESPAAAASGAAAPGAAGKFSFKKMFYPARYLGHFIKKHPYASTIGSGVLMAYLTNKANNAEDNKDKSKVPTLTPSEKMLLDRSNSGMDLPGLGLDPRFFTGSYYDSYLYL